MPTSQPKKNRANFATSLEHVKVKTNTAMADLFEGGYVPVLLLPVSMKRDSAGKAPAIFEHGEWIIPKDWPTLAKKLDVADLSEMINASSAAPNIGILCGEPVQVDGQHIGFLAGIDIDCAAPELVEALAKLFGDKFTCRKGNPERSGCIPVVLAIDTLENTIEVYHRKGDAESKIQILKAGKQFAAFGGHPSRNMYKWEDTSGNKRSIPAVADLPVVTMDALESALFANGFIRGAGKTGTKLDAKTKHKEVHRLLDLYRSGELPSFESLTKGDGAPYDGETLSNIAEDVEARYDDEETNGDGAQSRNAARQSFVNRVRKRFPTMGIENGFAVCLHFENVCGEFVASGKTTGQYTPAQFVKDWNNASAENAKEYEAAHEAKAIEKATRTTEKFGNVFDLDAYREYELKPMTEVKAKQLKQQQVDLQAEHDAKVKAREAVKVIEEETVTPSDSEEAKTTKLAKKLERLHKLFDCLADMPDVENDAVAWGIKHITALSTTSIMVGMWGAGKSAIAIDMGFAQSIGTPWGGKKTIHGVVIYCALENDRDIRRRLRALRRRAISDGKDVSRCAFVVWKAPIDLFDQSGQASRGEKDLIEVAMLNAERFGLPVVQIIVDTFAKSRGAGSENDATDAGLYVKSLDRIAQATGANVMALHHPTKGTDTARGSGAIEADVDTVLIVTKTGAICTLKASQIKFRIGDPSKVQFGYRLHGETTGIDEDGDPITVVLATDVAPVKVKEPTAHAADEEGETEEELIALCRKEKVADSSDLNHRLVAEAINHVAGREAFSDDRWVRQSSVLKEWNRRRGWRIGEDGKELPSRDNTALGRALGKMDVETKTEAVDGRNRKFLRLIQALD